VGNFRVEPPGLFLGRGAHPKMEACVVIWPLQDIAITNIVWCMAYTEGGGPVGGRILRNGRALVLQ